MERRGIGALVLGICGLGICFAASFAGDEGEARRKLAESEAKLDAVVADIGRVREEIKKENAKYHRFVQHGGVYTNSVTGAIYKEISALEKQLVEKRKQLKDALKEMPEYKEIDKTRREAYEKLIHLKEREALIRNEIEAAALRTAQTESENGD